jgi:hypothetical protein
MLGYYFAERIANEIGREEDLSVFLRWEQLAAYSRGEINGDWKFRGVERVKRNLQEGSQLRLGADSTSQILSDQKTYGLWGLYTVPARSSGLVEGDPSRLTVSARDLVEKVYLPIFSKNGLRNADAVVARLGKVKSNLDWQKSDRRLMKTVAAVFKNLGAVEREVYRRHLLLGGPHSETKGYQEILATAMESTLGDDSWKLSPRHVRHLAKRCRGNGDNGTAVAQVLEQIRTAELLLAPATALFELLLSSDDQTVTDVSHVVKLQWGSSLQTIDVDATTALEVELQDSSGERESGQRWVRVAKSLASGEFDRAVTLLMEQNATVMKLRAGAAPWVDVSKGRLRVRFRDNDGGGLPLKSQLPEFWRHSYFLDSLRAIALELRSRDNA